MAPLQTMARTSPTTRSARPIARCLVPTVLAVTLTLMTSALAGQRGEPDASDRIELINGRELTGQLKQVYQEEILLLQDGKRVRVPSGKVAQLDLRRERVERFLRLRASSPKTILARWALADNAMNNRLPSLARLQALELVLEAPIGPGHEYSEPQLERIELAHQLLGNRPRGKGEKRVWLWPHDGTFVTLDHLLRETSDWGDAFVLESEHFVMRTNGGPRRAIDALFDLETLLVWLHLNFGKELQLNEALDRVELRVRGSTDKFPRWNSGQPRNVLAEAKPYYVPHPFGAAAFTHYRPSAQRPDELFGVATQAILYRTLAEDIPVGNQLDRFAAWAELGLSQWVESCVDTSTPPGRVQFREPLRPGTDVDLSLRARNEWDIEDIPNFNLRDHFYNGLRTEPQLYWADTHMLVAFFMADPTLRPHFLEFLREALAEGKGTSSSLLDKALGLKIERLEKPWIEWLRSS